MVEWEIHDCFFTISQVQLNHRLRHWTPCLLVTVAVVGYVQGSYVKLPKARTFQMLFNLLWTSWYFVGISQMPWQLFWQQWLRGMNFCCYSLFCFYLCEHLGLVLYSRCSTSSSPCTTSSSPLLFLMPVWRTDTNLSCFTYLTTGRITGSRSARPIVYQIESHRSLYGWAASTNSSHLILTGKTEKNMGTILSFVNSLIVW